MAPRAPCDEIVSVEELRQRRAREAFDEVVREKLRFLEKEVKEKRLGRHVEVARRRRMCRAFARLMCRCLSVNGTLTAMGSQMGPAVKGAVSFAFTFIWMPYLKDAIDLTSFSMLTSTLTSFWVPVAMTSIVLFSMVVAYESVRQYGFYCVPKSRREARAIYRRIVRENIIDDVTEVDEWAYFSDDDPAASADFALLEGSVDENGACGRQSRECLRLFGRVDAAAEIPMIRTIVGDVPNGGCRLERCELKMFDEMRTKLKGKTVV